MLVLSRSFDFCIDTSASARLGLEVHLELESVVMFANVSTFEIDMCINVHSKSGNCCFFYS